MAKKLRIYFLIVWQFLFLFVVINIMLDVDLWLYLFRQAKGQMNIIYHTKSVDFLIEQKLFTKREEDKIKLIGEIKLFAEQKLGLKKTNNYSTYFDQQGKPVLWMLTACEPYHFNEKTWIFPMLGEVSYKGFFDFELAKQEAEKLKLQKYDVDIGKVSAWSTLGILSDPILSSMLDDEEGELAELIIHELTHSTLYFKDNVDFNENFASFIGKQGALQFITEKYGSNSGQLERYKKNMREEDVLKSFLLQKKESLDTLYHSMDKLRSDFEKEKQKLEKLHQINEELQKLTIYNDTIKTKITKKIKDSRNAYFMSFHRYDAQYQILLTEFDKHKGNLNEFIQFALNNTQWMDKKH